MDTEKVTIVTEQFFSFINLSGDIEYSFIAINQNDEQFINHSKINPCCSVLNIKNLSCKFCPYTESINNGIPIEKEFQGENNQWWNVVSSPAYDINGNRQGSFLVGKNITEARNNIVRVETSEEKYKLLFENSQEAIFIIQANKIVFYNSKLLQITGYAAEELKLLSVRDFIKKSKTSTSLRRIDKQLNGKSESIPIEIEIVNKTKVSQWISLTLVNIEWEGKPAILSFAYDITAKTIATQMLEKRDEQYRLLVENQTDLLVNVDSEGRFLFVSPSYCEMFDKTEKELLGKSFMPLVHVDDRLSTVNAFELLKVPPHTCYMEQRAYTVKGWRWLAWSDKAMVDKKGNVMSVIGVGRDIHEHKLAEIALHESERKLATLMSNLPGMVYRCKNNKDWTMEFVSEGCYELTGYSPLDLVNSDKVTFNDIISPDFRLEVWENWQIAIINKQPYQGEYKIITNKGETKWVFEQGQAIYNAYGEVLALEGFIQDITARKIADAELSNTTEKYRNLIDSSLVGIYTTSLNGQLLFTNEALADMLGYTVEEAFQLGNVSELYKNPADREKLIRDLKQHKKLSNVELTWFTKNRNEITVLLSAVLSDNYLSGMVMDITHRKQSEVELLKAKEKAIESDKLKSAFLANISHEIRTPLNGIIGFIDILLDQETDKSQKEHYSGLINDLSARLLSIVNDVIEISKVETNQIILRKTEFNLARSLNQVYNQHLKNAEKNNNALRLSVDVADNTLLDSDEGYLKQILGYLLDNALKFTKNGIVEFGYRKKATVLEFYVKDNGIGINSKNHKLIFERFRQIEESLTRKYNGSGLGLAITKALVEMLGGTISVDSEPGIGSEFMFTIPFGSLNTPPTEITANVLKNKKILVCDDDDFGFLYIKKVLSKAGLICLRAEDGTMAIELCNKIEDIDVIIMDMRMPGLSGVETAIKIRETNKKTPILGFTAYNEKEMEVIIDKTIFNGFIYKPVDVSAMLQLINSVLKT